MKKILIGLGILIVAVGLLVLLLVGHLDKIVKVAVERVGTNTLGTQVTLAGVDISLRSATGGLNGLTVANPEGFSEAHAFRLDQVSLDLDLTTVRSEEIVVESVVIDGAHVVFEEKGGRINLQELLNNVDAAPAEGPAEESESPAGEGPTLVIKEFRFTNAKARLISENLTQDVEVSVPDVILRDIGTKGKGVTTGEAAKQLLDPLIRQLLDVAQDQLMDQVKDKATKKIMENLPF